MSEISKPTFENEYYLMLTLLDRIVDEGKNIKQVKQWVLETLIELGED